MPRRKKRDLYIGPNPNQRKRGPDGRFLPRKWRGSYQVDGIAYNANGKRISKERLKRNAQRYAHDHPRFRRHVPSYRKRAKYPRTKDHEFGGYKGADFDILTADPDEHYRMFASLHLSKAIVSSGQETRYVTTFIGDYSPAEFEQAFRKNDFKSDPLERYPNATIVGYWRAAVSDEEGQRRAEAIQKARETRERDLHKRVTQRRK